MSNRDRLMADLQNLEYDRLAIQLMHDDISRITADLEAAGNSNTGDGSLCTPQNTENRSTCSPDRCIHLTSCLFRKSVVA